MNQTTSKFFSGLSNFCSKCIPLSFASEDSWIPLDRLSVTLSKQFNRKVWPSEVTAPLGNHRSDDERIEMIWQQKLSKAREDSVLLFNATKFRFHSIEPKSNSAIQLNLGITDYRYRIKLMDLRLPYIL